MEARPDELAMRCSLREQPYLCSADVLVKSILQVIAALFDLINVQLIVDKLTRTGIAFVCNKCAESTTQRGEMSRNLTADCLERRAGCGFTRPDLLTGTHIAFMILERRTSNPD